MIVGSDIFINAGECSDKELRKLFAALTFFDDEQNQVRCYRVEKGGVRIPRGALHLVPEHTRGVIEDHTIMPVGNRITYSGQLDYSDDEKSFSGQRDALNAAIKNKQGLIVAQPGFGKTQVALALVARLRTPAIVFVHTRDIMEQWIRNAETALPDAKVGFIQGENEVMGDIVIAMVQTVTQFMDDWKKRWSPLFGLMILDEAHHVAASSWERIVNNSPAAYRIGFTATETRADGMHPAIKHFIGPVIFKHKFASKVPVKIVPVKSNWKMTYRGMHDWQKLLAGLSDSVERNTIIANTALGETEKGESVLVLSRRIDHLKNIKAIMDSTDDSAVILTSKTPNRKLVLKRFREGKIKCILATQLADEALDVPRLSRVILSFPGKHDGRIIQQIGRALREHPTKDDAIIFDIVDDRISVLRRQWMERKATYKTLGIHVEKIKGVQYVSEKQRARELSHSLRRRLQAHRVSVSKSNRRAR